MRKKKTTKTVAKKNTSQNTPKKSVSETIARYLELEKSKSKIIAQICESMHLIAEFENEIVLSRLEFKDDTSTMLELEQFTSDMQKNYELIRDVEVALVSKHLALETINMELNNL